jgi:hypothetical protein
MNISNDDWINTEYKRFRQLHLFNTERSKFEESQPAANAYKNAKDIILKLPFNPENGSFKGKHNTKIDNLHVIFNNANMCISEYGVGWEDYDFDSGGLKKAIQFTSSFRCIYPDCSSIIHTSNEFTVTCNMCNGDICVKCQGFIINGNDADHICDKAMIKMLESLKSNTRSCPKCATKIFKDGGCDQMFCTQCHTTFSWSTARIEHGFKHNPHYLDWIKDQRLKNNYSNTRLSDINTCVEYISYYKLISCFPKNIWAESFKIKKKLVRINNLEDRLPSIEYYCLALRNFHSNILDIRSNEGNHANIAYPDNHDLRVRYLTNEIDENNMAETIESREYDWYKSNALFQIYDMVFQSAGDIFHSFSIRPKSNPELYYATYLELLYLIAYSNRYLSKYDIVFNTTTKKFAARPF